MPFRRKRWIVIAVVVAAGAGLFALWPTVATVALLLDLSGPSGQTGMAAFSRMLLPVHVAETAAEHISIPTRHGSLAARVDRPSGRPSDRPSGRPSGGATHTLVVFPGVHAGGLDEPRLTRFSRRIAGSGITVVTVPLPDLRAFRIVGQSTDEAEDVTAWVAANHQLAPSGRVSLAGVSFAGGIALVAAGRPSLAGRLESVVSFGGHGDLGHVLEYLCTGRLPDGTSRPPHDYSVAVVALAAVPHLVPTDEVAVLERGLLMFLNASADESPNHSQGRLQLADANRLRDTMPARSRQIMDWVLSQDVAALGAAIRPFIADLAKDPRLSPERSPAATAPVFLLHGQADTVIPSSETPRLAAYLEAHGNRNVHALLTPVLSHVGVDANVTASDWWRLIRFWRELEDAMKQK